MTKHSFSKFTQDYPHRSIVETALSQLNLSNKVAIDCGCGAGNESKYLLSQGFNVHAFDPCDESKEICQFKFQHNNHFEFSQSTFESYDFPKSSLIIALYSLFFCTHTKLHRVIQNMTQSLDEQGILLVQLLGDQDEWVQSHPEKFQGFNEQCVKALFQDAYEILNYEQEIGERKLANGTKKFWHLHSLILRKTTEKVIIQAA